MASKIQSHNFYVAITPYKVQGVEDQYNELSVFTSYNENVHKFYVSLHAGWKSTFGHGTMIMGDSNPLTASTMVYVKESPKNSQKTINEIGAALELAKDIIAALFDDREWDKLRVVVQNVARFGYTDVFKEQAEKYLAERVSKRYEKAIKPIESESNENNNSNSTTMAQNVKAADLIGKTIVVGDNQATIVIKSVDGDKLSGEFTKDGKTTPMSFPVSQLQGMTEKGLWKVMSDVGSMKSEEKPQPSALSRQTSDIKTEADVAEVQDIVPVVTPRAKSDGGSMKSEEKTQPSNIKHQPSYVYSTYQTNKGKTGAKITGVSETDAAYQQAAAIHASGSYTKDKDGNKHYYLCFGPRYAEAAKKVCELLNAGKPIEDAIAVVNAATEERATKREEWKQKREERKAQKKSEGRGKMEDVHQTSAISPQTSNLSHQPSNIRHLTSRSPGRSLMAEV